MRLPTLPSTPSPAAAALLRPALSALAALVITASTTAPAPLLAAEPKVPTADELSRLQYGLVRIDFLLDNWDAETTVCNTNAATLTGAELKQQVATMDGGACKKTPLKVQSYIGAASTKDPLFKVDKLMLRAQPLVPESKQEAYTDAVDLFIAQQQMATSMAYTSSWSGYENPGGNAEKIDEALVEAKAEVLKTEKLLRKVIDLLELKD